MPPLRDLVRDRLRELGLKQQDLAAALDLAASHMSAILTGERPAPVTDADRWADALRLIGDARERLLTAMHLANSTPFVRDLVERLEAEAANGRRLDLMFRDRVGTLRFILDHLAAAGDGPQGAPGAIPPVTMDARQLLKLIEDLARAARQAEAADVRRVAETAPPYEPPGPG